MENEIEIIHTPAERRRKIVSTIATMVVVLVLAIVTAVLLKTYVIFTIPVGGDSMLPTLKGGQYITDENGKVVETVAKGDVLVLNKVAKVQRGDIVVFDVKWQSDPLVKRVIGVGGDHIEIKNDGKVYVNGIALEEDYIKGATYSADGNPINVIVPDGYIFCLGDNRENSHDSRHSDIGIIPIENVRGKCILVSSADGKLYSPY